ncbi:thiopeptide-type bacteriocin biosynthesis protein [Frankia sp. AgB1.9]|uniref:thiopeptide-type bacteriocin biosynthesis protein n=1 Tax=unclassified Frankia TaxID=2632575 RepID=UPI00193410EC|nr:MULTISPECIES: thiopeptide-type bacteriocin biosynthesis protein [unclassified Frankia]MBL7487888.1 thiopeptide-type bacteriocin biosynthesis protein [Frankia sp. AgW1.1]MBL7549953.1 thiopeptide-type bacteriocin biosynthesis protein [Frankia sp. AgB1.9]MBL7621468.1 thiopeptide-type bacteriocin biosynthesis protein [Frankia sp. AgB1.8]
MDESGWQQVNITYPGADPEQRERHAVGHLAHVLPAAEVDGLITAWFFIRKGPWRVRYLLAQDTAGYSQPDPDPIRARLIDGVRWTDDIYEPEVHAFGGPASMNTAHKLFHRDSHHLLTYLHHSPADRREHSLVLCTALMRAAGLDLNEQGDVWARIAEQRAPLAGPPPDPGVWTAFTSDIRGLLLGDPRADVIGSHWLTAFEETGRALRTLRERGDLTRGIRAIIALHVIFHWNRLGIAAVSQATLAQAAMEAAFGNA